MPRPPCDGISLEDDGESRRADVLHGDDCAGLARFEARLDQQLLDERIADLHRRPLGLALLVELGRRDRSRHEFRRGPVAEPT